VEPRPIWRLEKLQRALENRLQSAEFILQALDVGLGILHCLGVLKQSDATLTDRSSTAMTLAADPKPSILSCREGIEMSERSILSSSR
jgi:hypothetical protein